MSQTMDTPQAGFTPERLLDDRQRFWGRFRNFVWTVATGIAILLILLAYFLV